MRRLRALHNRVFGFFRKQQRESEFEQELASHVEMQTEENIRAGMSANEARRQAILKLGGLLAGAIGAATLMRSPLFQLRGWDVTTMVGVSALLACSALIASYHPARRAASVNPVEALKAE